MTQIVPYDQITTKQISGFDIQNVDLILFNSARICVRLLDENGNMLDLTFVTMEGEDYTNWGSDDSYIINYVATKLGFTIIN
jgi:hypothetical protein